MVGAAASSHGGECRVNQATKRNVGIKVRECVSASGTAHCVQNIAVGKQQLQVVDEKASRPWLYKETSLAVYDQVTRAADIGDHYRQPARRGLNCSIRRHVAPSW